MANLPPMWAGTLTILASALEGTVVGHAGGDWLTGPPRWGDTARHASGEEACDGIPRLLEDLQVAEGKLEPVVLVGIPISRLVERYRLALYYEDLLLVLHGGLVQAEPTRGNVCLRIVRFRSKRRGTRATAHH